ncbi:roadblock/LC7 domain-containing protein [Streptomyces sp. NBC_00102]|uniref:roadblock/LC7 domain-containing protein n=1 Tax=Streptomyces sp. NBC_00102 TaxID=2975652 RepID=UPI00224ECB71|nr:roadblock/LC7 domain-containing protein [Streptomyces sp. NBC_00102]MCX5400461.1 roadblock/LC7 domain-containing protein [Streptomyces sp. NBC_00102]
MRYDARTAPSAEAANFNWLLEQFADKTSGVTEAVAVSSDGLLIAASHVTDRPEADRLAAVISGMTSLAFGASANRGLGALDKVIVDYSEGYLVVSSIGVGCVLGVVAEKSANLGNLAYEITLFAQRAGAMLTPHLIDELKNSVPS